MTDGARVDRQSTRKGAPFAGLVLGAALLLSALPSSAAVCMDCARLSAPETALAPGDTLELRIDFDADKLPGVASADAYLAVVNPDNQLHVLRTLKDWGVRDLTGEPFPVDALKGLGAGEYQFHFVLVPPGEDPLVSTHWHSASTLSVALLPAAWQREAAPPPAPLRSDTLPAVISHGGGEVRGLQVSNSLEALDQGWAAGQRLFELDFSWTSDGHLVLMHDWGQSYRRLFGREEGSAPELRDFLAMGMSQGLSQLDIYGLLEWLDAHPEARVVTDIKEDNLRGLDYIAIRAGELQDRFIPQIYDPAEYDGARERGFETLIYSLYRSPINGQPLLDFLAGHPVAAVTLPYRQALADSLAARLAEQGVFVYAHSVNHPALALWLRTRGVSGVYSDALAPAALAP